MIELRQNTQQLIIVGPVLTKITRLTDPFIPIYGALLSQCMFAHLIKADGTTIMLPPREWQNVDGGASGFYKLLLLTMDTDILGSLYFYAYKQGIWEMPVTAQCSVISQNMWDAKYDSKLLKVEFAQTG